MKLTELIEYIRPKASGDYNNLLVTAMKWVNVQ